MKMTPPSWWNTKVEMMSALAWSVIVAYDRGRHAKELGIPMEEVPDDLPGAERPTAVTASNDQSNMRVIAEELVGQNTSDQYTLVTKVRLSNVQCRQ